MLGIATLQLLPDLEISPFPEAAEIRGQLHRLEARGQQLHDYATTNYAKKVAFQFVDGGQQYTYADFRTKTERLSQRMSRFGIKHGDRVAIFSQNMPHVHRPPGQWRTAG